MLRSRRSLQARFFHTLIPGIMPWHLSAAFHPIGEVAKLQALGLLESDRPVPIPVGSVVREHGERARIGLDPERIVRAKADRMQRHNLEIAAVRLATAYCHTVSSFLLASALAMTPAGAFSGPPKACNSCALRPMKTSSFTVMTLNSETDILVSPQASRLAAPARSGSVAARSAARIGFFIELLLVIPSIESPDCHRVAASAAAGVQKRALRLSRLNSFGLRPSQ